MRYFTFLFYADGNDHTMKSIVRLILNVKVLGVELVVIFLQLTTRKSEYFTTQEKVDGKFFKHRKILI